MDAHMRLALLIAAALAAVWGLAQAVAQARMEDGPTPQAVMGGPIRQCVNIGNALEAPTEGEWGHVITERDLDRIAGLGFDTVRLPIAWSEHLDGQGRIDPAFLARVDEVLRWSELRGLNAILDVHHFWALEEDADAHIPTLLGIWDQLAAHYRNASPRVIFEIVNEPSGDFTVAKVNAVNREALRRIRRTNPDRWVILGSGAWGTIAPFETGAREAFEPVSDPRAIATFHTYTPYEFTHQGVTFADDPPPVGRSFGGRADVADVLRELDEAAAFSARSGMPMLLGEFGVYRRTVSLDERLAWTRFLRAQSEARGLPWCYFDWATEFRMYDPEADEVLPGFRGALGLN